MNHVLSGSMALAQAHRLSIRHLRFQHLQSHCNKGVTGAEVIYNNECSASTSTDFAFFLLVFDFQYFDVTQYLNNKYF